MAGRAYRQDGRPRLCRINWRTTGAIVARVVADELDDSRLDELYHIGVDEVAYRGQHEYLTLVADHDSGTIVWADEGRDSAALTRFFDDLGPDRAPLLQAISLDMSAPYLKAIAEHDDVDATACFDPFHVVQVRHEAPFVRVGCKDPPPVCRSRSVKLEAA